MIKSKLDQSKLSLTRVPVTLRNTRKYGMFYYISELYTVKLEEMVDGFNKFFEESISGVKLYS